MGLTQGSQLSVHSSFVPSVQAIIFQYLIGVNVEPKVGLKVFDVLQLQHDTMQLQVHADLTFDRFFSILQ